MAEDENIAKNAVTFLNKTYEKSIANIISKNKAICERLNRESNLGSLKQLTYITNNIE